MNTIVEINLNRLEHLLTLFRLSKEELLVRASEGLKNRLLDEDIFRDEIKLSHLKRIDKHVFQKGLDYYLDPKDLSKSKDQSIFFRKDDFNAKLNLGSKQIVNKFEEEKIAFSTLVKLSDFKLERKLPVFNTSDNPKTVAFEVRTSLYPEFVEEKRDFLKNLIERLADANILVFEFVETHNKKEKANINGFFLSPNVIVLKRNQKAMRREIFTLAHEVGHYLLGKEEIDNNVYEVSSDSSSDNIVERWCNDFAYHFLAGNSDEKISSLSLATPRNDFHQTAVEEISRDTHLSTISLYTRLLVIDKISPFHYSQVRDDILEQIAKWREQEKRKREREKLRAIDGGRKVGGRTPQPIISPLYKRTLQTALYTGVINEVDFCKKLKIKPDKI